MYVHFVLLVQVAWPKQQLQHLVACCHLVAWLIVNVCGKPRFVCRLWLFKNNFNRSEKFGSKFYRDIPELVGWCHRNCIRPAFNMGQLIEIYADSWPIYFCRGYYVPLSWLPSSHLAWILKNICESVSESVFRKWLTKFLMWWDTWRWEDGTLSN